VAGFNAVCMHVYLALYECATMHVLPYVPHPCVINKSCIHVFDAIWMCCRLRNCCL